MYSNAAFGGVSRPSMKQCNKTSRSRASCHLEQRIEMRQLCVHAAIAAQTQQ